ncbi:MAG: flagellar basal body-associated FliL family protein [Halanaerobium sp.]|nr:flagellar basal body-associated FliL family protein [Halanaerobium sp.]
MSDEKKKRMGLPIILIIVFSTIILAGLTSFLVFNFLGGTAQSGNGAATEASQELGPTYSLGQFIVNLQTDGGYRFLKAQLVAEISNEDLVGELDERNPQVRDILIKILRSVKKEDLEDPGNDALKERMRAAVNQVLSSGEIKEIFFTEFVIQ